MKTIQQQPVIDVVRITAIDKALQYHSQVGGHVYGTAYPGAPTTPRPSADEVIATAQKFLGFLLVDKKTVETRAKR